MQAALELPLSVEYITQNDLNTMNHLETIMTIVDHSNALMNNSLSLLMVRYLMNQ